MEEELLIAFDSTQQALRAEMLLEYAEIEIDIFPTPKEITAGCAMSIQFFRGAIGEVRKIIAEQDVEIRGIYGKDNKGRGYTLITEGEGVDE
ncbi:MULTISPECIES: DUF3343 domain-containing protein [unclassified Paenibacillus]|uniref:DUF3343 domain-containing protein n=1 Tax=unclassified Paenibacillus TaxID=185978 RepID=UPI0004F6BDD7|nr:DUF3343 domain-containing protein [Paenibacillus sp. FSL H7-0357]AIQ21372.1 hypothetical protein H70357_35290 [Paenibacillus sp. FSL H7-0357]